MPIIRPHAPIVKYPRRLARRVIFGALVVFIVYAWEYALEWHRRELVQGLVTDVQLLRAGVTTETEIQRLSQRYGGTYSGAEKQGDSDEPAHYIVVVLSPLLIIRENYHVLPGRRAWGAKAYLPIENGHLSSVHFVLNVIRSDGLTLEPYVDLTGNKPLAAPDEVSYSVHQGHVTSLPLTELLGVELSPAATANERKKSFDFNLSCLTGFRECRHVCEVMPSAWRDLSVERRMPYGEREKAIDSECRERLH